MMVVDNDVCVVDVLYVYSVYVIFFLMLRRLPLSTCSGSSAASDVYYVQFLVFCGWLLLFVVVGGCGCLWLSGCGCLWLVVVVWLWLFVVGCGWLWVVVAVCGWLVVAARAREPC